MKVSILHSEYINKKNHNFFMTLGKPDKIKIRVDRGNTFEKKIIIVLIVIKVNLDLIFICVWILQTFMAY